MEMKVFVATDFSETSQKAIAYAKKMTSQMECKLGIVHIFDSSLIQTPLPYYPAEHHFLDEFIKKARDKGKIKLDETAKDVGENCEVYFLEGKPSKQLIKFVEENDVDLLILGTHGYTGLSRLFLGSVAESVLRKAQCPVLTIRS